MLCSTFLQSSFFYPRFRGKNPECKLTQDPSPYFKWQLQAIIRHFLTVFPEITERLDMREFPIGILEWVHLVHWSLVFHYFSSLYSMRTNKQIIFVLSKTIHFFYFFFILPVWYYVFKLKMFLTAHKPHLSGLFLFAYDVNILFS